MSMMLRYAGPTVDDGRMDVYDVAANMTAFSEYVVVAAHAVYGDQVEVRAEVTAFTHGSFGTDLLFHLAGAGAAIWSVSPDLGGLLTTVKESLGLFRFLKGEPPAAVTHVDHRTAHVTNNNGQFTVVQIESLTVALDPKAGIAAEQFVGKALSRAGVDCVAISSSVDELVAVERGEAHFFKRLSADQTVTDAVVEMALTIEMPGFREGLKWRFSDGDRTFAATVDDPEFLARVDAGEAFRKGDTLLCDVRVVQTQAVGGGLTVDRTIIRVRRHSIRPDQPDLPFDRTIN